jgi:hypothetical protein
MVFQETLDRKVPLGLPGLPDLPEKGVLRGIVVLLDRMR